MSLTKKGVAPLFPSYLYPIYLIWNSCLYRHVLASGSVDQTVLLWDLNGAKIASTLKTHQDKVQTLAWHPFEAQNLLTGCCDGYQF